MNPNNPKLVTVKLYPNTDGSSTIELNEGVLIIAPKDAPMPDVFLKRTGEVFQLTTGEMFCLISLEDGERLLELGATAKK